MEGTESICHVHDHGIEDDIFLTPPHSRRTSLHISRKSSWGTPIPPPPNNKVSESLKFQTEPFNDINLKGDGVSLATAEDDNWNTLENITALGLSFSAEEPVVEASLAKLRFSLEDHETDTGQIFHTQVGGPFDRWMKTLNRKAALRRKTVSGSGSSEVLTDELHLSRTFNSETSRHKKSSSGSSLGFVTAIKSATMSLASISVAPQSRWTFDMSSRQPRAERSSRASAGVGRASEDSSYLARGVVIDQAVTNRAIRRRRILEEIISTEEGYLGDIKFLMNVYITLLASIPTISLSLRSSISQNLSEIVEIHEELLGDLHRIVPHSEYTEDHCTPSVLPQTAKAHHRWRSLDAVPEDARDNSWLHKVPGMTADASIAAEVAKAFGQKMHRFFAYEEYGAKYEMMVKDVASTYRTLPQWEVYQTGLEALAASVASINKQHDNSRKSLTIGDLLVKPIQRVCRYPLLFVELLKQTPVCDCPDSHAEIEKVLARLRETTAEINKATDDPRVRQLLEKTWILQDRLVFPDQNDIGSKSAVRVLGHIQLCGVLHATWQTRDGVDSQYMITLLYRECLVLASASKADQTYTVMASISLSNIRVEDADNGRGLQCHTAPSSWKLVFECDHQLYEMILSACSPKEELEWRSRLTERAYREQTEPVEQTYFTSLSLGMKPMGSIFGKPGTIARRISIHRATTVGPKSSLCQVIIKNTSAFKEISSSASSASINRSQSLLTTNRIPVLAPSRVERVRLETLLADVWTRDILPFPGMTGRARSEHPVRASASSMMRKLSVASIASNFTKHSGSLASLASFNRLAEEECEDLTANANIISPYLAIHEDLVPGSSSVAEFNNMSNSCLLIFDDEKSQSDDQAPVLMNATNASSPVGTVKRLATLRKKGLSEGYRNITPPLRTSSVNSVRQVQRPFAGDTPGEGNENMCQPKHLRWVKGGGLNKGLGFSKQSLKGLFR